MHSCTTICKSTIQIHENVNVIRRLANLSYRSLWAGSPLVWLMENHVKHVLERKVFVMVWLKEILARHVLEHQVFLGWSAEPADRGVDSSGMGRLSGTADLSSGRPRGRQLRSGSAVWDG